MSDYHSDDVAMHDDTATASQDGSSKQEDSAAKAMTDSQLTVLDRKAREHYHIKLSILREKMMYKPSLDTIYFNPADTFLSNIPEDLFLEILLNRYNDLAAHNFTAIQDSDIQDDQLMRLIWDYGLDEHHSFNRYFSGTRYNVIIMAYVWASGFDTQYCDPSVKPMLVSFIKAWLATLETSNENRNDFTVQDNFI